MSNIKKDHLALYIGFVLIMFVFLLTVFRAGTFNSKKNDSVKEDSSLEKKSEVLPKYKTISATDLQKKLLIASSKNSITLLDIRSFEAYSAEHIMDSIGIPLNEFPIQQKFDAKNQIVVIGQDKNDAGIETAVEALKKEKYENILVLAGGMDSWKQLLGPTVTYGNPKSFVDQSKVSYFDPEELKKAIETKQPLFIVDVRSNEEFNKGHIQGAINIPFDNLEKERGKITERRIVVVGANELQEFQASVQIYDMLLASPFVMRTAMPGWQSKGYELVK